jgi:hypothetical protein
MLLQTLAFLTLHFAAADTPVFTMPPEPTMIKVPGQPIEAIWPSGNRAQIKVNRNAPIVVPVVFGLTENFCSAAAGKTFEARLAVKLNRIGWVWTQHSDPKRVGTIVKLRQDFAAPGLPLVSPSFGSNVLRFTAPDMAEGLPADELHFTETDWIPGLEDGKMKPFTIDTWMAEAMLPNPETGLNENRIAASIGGVHTEPIDGTSVRISQMDSGSAVKIDSNAFMMVGDVVTWVFRRDSGSCQMSFKPNIGPAMAIVLKYLAGAPDDFAAYKFQEDSLYDQTNSFITDLLRYADE